MKMLHKVLPVILLISVVLIAGCAQSSPTTPPVTTPPSTPTIYNVAIQNFAFSPASLTVHVGDTIVWTNMDNVAHTILSDSGSEISSSALSTGQTYSHTFTTAGTFSYHCGIHPSMKASVTVV